MPKSPSFFRRGRLLWSFFTKRASFFKTKFWGKGRKLRQILQKKERKSNQILRNTIFFATFSMSAHALKCKIFKLGDFLACYISKLIPQMEKIIATHLIIRLVCQGPPRPLKRGLKAPGGTLKWEFVKFEGLLVCYLSKLVSVIGQLIMIHFIIRLVCQGPPVTLKGALGP